MHKTFFKNLDRIPCSICGKYARFYSLIKDKLFYMCDNEICQYHVYNAWRQNINDTRKKKKVIL